MISWLQKDHLQAAMRLCFSAFLLLLVGSVQLLSSSGQSAARERITDYKVHISVQSDRSIEVTETIEVDVKGQIIKRGLLRDIPVKYQDEDGTVVFVDLVMQSVRRNGQSEPYQRTNEGRYTRLRIGDADVFLPHTKHTYEIRYKVKEAVGFFDEFDEIYWNAIGTEWAFGIDKAEVTVQLPSGANLGDYSVYSGAQRRGGGDYTVINQTSNALTVQSSQSFLPREGMTIAVNWQKGIVLPPTEAELREREALKNSPMTFLGFAGLLQFGWLYFAWRRVGKDPDGGAIIPRYRAPKDLSPAVASYISGLGSFEKSQQSSFMAALINLSIKRFVVIDNKSKDMTVRREKDVDEAQKEDLPVGEKALYSKLLGKYKSTKFSTMTYERMSGVMRAFASAIDEETDQVYYRRNTGYMVPGFILATLGFLAFIVASVSIAPPYEFPLFELVAAGVILGVFFLCYAVWRWFTKKAKLGKVLMVPFFMLIFASSIIAADFDANGDVPEFNVWAVAFLVVMVLALFFFTHWMKAPTKLGREVMDEIEGLKLFMTVTVAEQAEEVGADMPELTPKLYEELLPYAIALGVEKQWSKTFEDKVFSQLPPDQSYQPIWYHGKFDTMHPAATFASMTDTLGTDLSSAMTPPASSSSGSSGGGSSGGGGGGGGGGGW